MAGYSARQSTFTSGDTITAAHSNDEFNQLLAAFNASTGHTHDGTAGDGGPVTTLRDTDALNKIFVDTSNNHLEFYVEVSSAAVQQIRIQDGAIVPITDSDIDLGTSSLEFKDLFIDGTANIDALVADTADINGGTVDGATLGTNSAITQAVIDNINIDGATIGHTSDTDLLTLASGILTVAGEISVTTLDIGGTNVTSTAAELNILDGVTSTAAELNLVDGITAGTISASLAVIVDSNKDISGFRNVTLTGELDAATGDFSGDVDVDGTLEADAITVNGTTLAEFISDTTGAMFSSNTETGITVTYQDSDNTIDLALAAAQTTITSLLATDIKIGEDNETKIDFETADEIHFYAANAEQVYVADGIFGPQTDSDVDLGSTSVRWKDAFVDSLTTTGDLTIGGNFTVNGTTTTVATTNMVVADNLIELNNGASSNSNDSGIVIERGSTGDNAIFAWDESADTFVLGTTTATGSSTGNLTIADGALQAGSLDISGDIDVDGTTNLDVVDIDGAVDMASTLQVDGAITSSSGATITVSDNTAALELISTDADANVGPRLSLYRNSASPADNDILGDIRFMGEDDASAKLEYAKIEAQALDVSDGSIDTQLRFQIRHAGSGNDILKLTPTEVVFNEGSFDTDFRIESNSQSSAFFIDANNETFDFNIPGTITVSDNSNTLSLVSTDADANAGPILSMRRESASPADNDLIGQVDFIGKDSGGTNTQYASIKGIIKDATHNTEDGALEFVTFKSGFLNNALTLGNTETVFNDASVDVDFRVETNAEANAFVIDAGNEIATFNIPINAVDGIDVAGDFIFDIGGGDLEFRDDGTSVVNFGLESGNFIMNVVASNTDLIFKGNDGGSAITALTLDMSNAGAATFNNKIIATELDISGDVDVDGTLETDALSIASTTVTATAAEINLIDGGTARGTTAIADGDGILHNDNGTMRMTSAATFKTYFQSGISSSSSAADDITVGDAAVNITTSSGNITIDAAANDTDIIFKGTDNSSDITMLTLDGSDAGTAIFNHDIKLADNGVAKFGDSSDLQIYHDGSHSRIDDTGTGDLILRGNDQILLEKYTGETFIQCNADAGVALYHNDVKKFETTSSGITVTGNVSNASGDFTLDVAGDINLDADGGDILFKDATTEIGRFTNSSSNFVIKSAVSDKDLIIKGNDSGSEITTLTFDMSAAGEATFGNNVRVNDNSKIMAGTGNDLQISHDGSNSIINAAGTGGLLLQNNTNNQIVSIQSDDASGGLTDYVKADGGNGNVLLYFYGSEKLKTINTGLEITGHVLPDADDTYDLGSSSKQWRDIYTGDINLNNTKTRDNEVDGSRGSWTIQEGSDDLFLLNRLNGKKYKFNLTEV